MPESDWQCKVETNDETSETFTITSQEFNILITTLPHNPVCTVSTADPSCEQKPFYENKSISLSTWSINGKLQEILGTNRVVINNQPVTVSFSIKYTNMANRLLEPDEKQDLVDFLDGISYGK